MSLREIEQGTYPAICQRWDKRVKPFYTLERAGFTLHADDETRQAYIADYQDHPLGTLNFNRLLPDELSYPIDVSESVFSLLAVERTIRYSTDYARPQPRL